MYPPVPTPQINPVKMATPKEGPSIVPINADFSQQPGYLVDLSVLYNGGKLSQVVTVFADNSLNSSPLVLIVQDTGQKITWPAFSYGYMPVMQSSNLKFSVASAGGIAIQIEFLNFAIAPGIYSANGTPVLTGNGALSVSDSILESAVSNNLMNVAINGNVSWTDASGTITTGGTQQQALAANPARKAIQLMNISAGDLWYRWTGNAAIGGTSSFKLVAGAYYESAPGLVSNNALSIIGATTGQQFSLVTA